MTLRALCSSVALAILFTPAAAARDRQTEVRGLWVLETSLTSRESIAAMVRRAQAGGFNTLLVAVRPRGEAFYTTALEPRASQLDPAPADFDPLATTLDIAHKAGLRVHAWISVNRVSNAVTVPRSRQHIISRHPEWLMVPRELSKELQPVDPRTPGYIGRLGRWSRAASKTVEGLYLSPITVGSRDYSASVVSDLVGRYAIDGIHFDYARYPNDDFDYSASALGEFRDWQRPKIAALDARRLDGLAATDVLAWTKAYPDAWSGFRRDRMNQLMDRLKSVSKMARPSVIVSAAVTANVETARTQFQDWPRWAASGFLDVLCPLAYTTDGTEFAALVTHAKELVTPTPLWVGIGAWQLPVARAADDVLAARRAGAAGVLVFSYDSLADANARAGDYFAELRRLALEGPGLTR